METQSMWYSPSYLEHIEGVLFIVMKRRKFTEEELLQISDELDGKWEDETAPHWTQ